MENRDMEHKIEIPQEWQPDDDYSSHRPLLYIALKHTSGRVIEAGMGLGSTRLLDKYCHQHGRPIASFDNNKEWLTKMGALKQSGSTFVSDWLQEGLFGDNIGLLFIDCAPGEVRKHLLRNYADKADIIVIHDTEEYAQRVYEIIEPLKQFKYRLDLHIPAHPSTTAISNVIDVSQWKFM
jgi:hypothetical protein